MGRRKNDTKTEIKIITTRLIEISMKVDDYVYKHIPISESDAEKYIMEVSAYKVQCGQDQRSLQVIEKLTRCMQAIIRDHQEMRNDIKHDSPIEAGDNRRSSVSPVYSIPDEDRNQLTQVAEEKGGDDEEVTADIDIIDLTVIEDVDNFNNKTATEYNVEVEIHRGISNLSLQDVEHTLKDRTEDTNSSQSILNNFETIENMQQNKINSITPKSTVPIRVVNFCNINKANNKNKDATINKINNKNSFSQSLNKLNSGTVSKKPIIISKDNLITSAAGETNGIQVVQPNAFIPKNDNLISNEYLASNISESQIHTCQDADRTCTINTLHQDANIIQTPQNKETKTSPITNMVAPNYVIPTNSYHEVTKSRHILNNNKTLKVANNKKNIANSMAIAHSVNSVDIKKTIAARKTRDTTIVKNTTTNKTKKRKANIMPVLEKHKKVPIYNRNVIDDLSWIENIRYVREIAEGENDCKLQLDDDFWDNYYLPANWNDNEFS